MLARLHWGGGPVSAESVWLHAHLQAFGFFGTLIVGVAHHLVPRFAGRPVTVTPLAPWLAGALGAALGLRIVGAVAGVAVLAVAAALFQALAFGLFAAWVARALGAPHVRLTRAYLTARHGLARPRPRPRGGPPRVGDRACRSGGVPTPAGCGPRT